jgi:hypothetical protein
MRLGSVLVYAAAAMAMLAVLDCAPVEGQLLRRRVEYQTVVQEPAVVYQSPICNGADCQPGGTVVTYGPVLQPSVVAETAAPVADGARVTAEQWYTILVGPNGRTLTEPEKRAAKEWSLRAARTYQGNGCGTSNLCGRDSNSTYWLTNAHVASTTIGRQCRLQVLEGGQIRSFTAVVVEAAYSSRTRTDWALLKGPPDVLPGVQPIRLSKEKPDPNKTTVTWGCPRCEPVRGQIVETVSMGSVWYWLPNSIGGQSGSAMIQDGNEVGLLTWTENGRGSGQFTATIWAQSRNQNTDGPARTGFEVPVVAHPLPATDLREGYFAAPKETGDLGEYPIWADSKPVDPVDPTDPDNPICTPDSIPGFRVVYRDGQIVLLKASTAPAETSWFLDFALYCWQNKDQLIEKGQEITALVEWFRQFVADYQQTSDTGSLEAELGQLIDATGFPMEAERGDLLRQLILYAIQNPEQIRQWIDFIKSLLG